VFVANTDTYQAVHNFNLPRFPGATEETVLAFEFSTERHALEADKVLSDKGYGHKISKLGPGEGRVYRIVQSQSVNP
jgi:hypothetical protein